MDKKIVLLAGGSGLIGKHLSKMLKPSGYEVRILTRSPKNPGDFAWDPLQGSIDIKALEGVHYVVNLTGAGIADKRWTASRKKLLVDSRVASLNTLSNALVTQKHKPRAFVSASAIGYYGNSGEQKMSEDDAPANGGFMVDCCQQWEAPVQSISGLGIRTTTLRIGIVLSTEGGALAETIKPMRFGLAAYFGNGKAWWSWIHIDDVCRMMIWALENATVSGVYNAVAPNPIRGKELIRQTVRALHKAAIVLPAPAFALRLVFGEMADVLLNSNYILSRKTEEAGFEYAYPKIEEALRAIFSKSA